jgi:predicted secreted hydrolase
MAIDLRLEPGKSPTDQGVDGVSQKGDEIGNASHYYSLTRMPTSGTLVVDGLPIQVQGLSWMDHEFGTSVLEKGQTGWNWFALQLDDGTDLMLYEFKRADGRRDRHSSGSLVDDGGRRTRLDMKEFSLDPRRYWKSVRSGAAYPISWHISVPSQAIDLQVRAAISDQELVTGRSGVIYWEGAVTVEGMRGRNPVLGRGYLEMTGYAGTLTTRMLQ